MDHVTFVPTVDQLNYTFGGAQPVLRIRPGTVLTLWTEDAYGGRITSSDDVASTGERLSFDEGRVRSCPPPGRFDRPPPIRGDDEIDALLVEPLPELPPRRCAAVTEVEIDGRRGNEQLHTGSVS